MRHLKNGTSDHNFKILREKNSIQTTPQKLGKITLETTFGHSKMVFQPLIRINAHFLKIPQCPDFENLGGLSHHQDVPKNQEASHGTFVFTRIAFSSHVLVCLAVSDRHKKALILKSYKWNWYGI